MQSTLSVTFFLGLLQTIWADDLAGWIWPVVGTECAVVAVLLGLLGTPRPRLSRLPPGFTELRCVC